MVVLVVVLVPLLICVFLLAMERLELELLGRRERSTRRGVVPAHPCRVTKPPPHIATLAGPDTRGDRPAPQSRHS
ncbi:hypothetical protein BJF90_19640 [Pseudonocardia sp. CNS-004]|nr:hypothetical protein BJF90_19640 [Pseudonocardia sp. CNS-004]